MRSTASRDEITSSMMPYSSASSASITKSRSVSLWIRSMRLAGVLGEDLLEQVAHPQDLLGRQLEVGDLAVADLAVGLVEQDPAVRQGEALALGAGGEQHRGRRRRLAEADRGDVVLDELHRVVDREQRRDVAAGAVDVDVDVLVGVLATRGGCNWAQIEVGDRVVDRRAQEDDVLLEQPRVEVVVPRSPRLVCSTTLGTQ